MKTLHFIWVLFVSVTALFFLSSGLTLAQEKSESQNIENLQQQIQLLEEQVEVMREKLDFQAESSKVDAESVTTQVGDDAKLNGRLVSVDASRAYADGPYVLRIRTQNGNITSVHVPARGSGQCDADISVQTVRNATPGQPVSVRGKRMPAGL
jgi:TolA-binding protein